MKLFIILLLCLPGFSTVAQDSKPFQLDAVHHFPGVGGAGKTSLRNFYDQYCGTGVYPVIEIRLQQPALDTLNNLLKSVKSKKHKPIKVNCCTMAMANYANRYTGIAFFDWGIVIILTQREYVFKGTEYEETFKKLVANNFKSFN